MWRTLCRWNIKTVKCFRYLKNTKITLGFEKSKIKKNSFSLPKQGKTIYSSATIGDNISILKLVSFQKLFSSTVAVYCLTHVAKFSSIEISIMALYFLYLNFLQHFTDKTKLSGHESSILVTLSG